MLVNGLRNNKNKYPEAVRKFCFRMQFHSSSAYRELRNFFNNNLPTIRCLQKWFKSVDASPGITQVALDVITEKASSYKSQGKQLYLCLIYDEISLRKQVIWNESKISFEGFSEITNPTKKFKQNHNENEVPIVKDALVYMVAGLDFRITVAYQLIAGMNAIDRAALTKEVIRCIFYLRIFP